ncbi:hypothetical protein GOP47_0002068 [Adiantum capillus-veneris]|uniref:Uncharacterized protein n=1 Tax=Adiantum capillus-veneris TaxID=13818 RepID=A0A9D4VA81_ADICA|nr:hypothetical protein GOP47_0002068 [Adiantum capillus-veneris]
MSPCSCRKSRASWRARCCQVGLEARSMNVHVSNSHVVSWPVKKKVLHSSISCREVYIRPSC